MHSITYYLSVCCCCLGVWFNHPLGKPPASSYYLVLILMLLCLWPSSPLPAGTEEHHIRTGMDPHHHAGMGTMGTTGTGMGTIGTGMGTTGTMGTHDTHHTGMGGTGLGATGLGATGLGATGMGAGHHTGMGTTGTGTGYNEEGKETIGHKVKKMIPGGCGSYTSDVDCGLPAQWHCSQANVCC